MPLTHRAARVLAPALLAALFLPSIASANPGSYWAASDSGVCGTPDNTFTVPAGVTQIHVGAAGADGSASPFMTFQFARSAVIQADLNVTPGQKLYACMGVGGGAGGGVGAGAGGGYASLANGSDGSDAIIVAGGGGGAGSPGMSSNVALGGSATLPGGSPGHGDATFTLNGGNSASDSAAGTGGTHPSDFTYDGADGNGSAGGAGGIATPGSGAGGGGGGGYFGGGGGAGATDGTSHGAGGGGGSSFCAVTCNSQLRSGMGASPAMVSILWTPAPAMSLSGDGDFGDVKLGETATRTYTVTSTGTGPLDLTMFGVTGGDPDFGFGAYTCDDTLAVGDECTVDVKFTPTTEGPHTGTFTVAADGIANRTIALTANATKPPSDPTPPTSTDTGTAPPAPQTITPTPTACVSRRVVDLKVPGIYRKALVSAKAQIAGKTVSTLKNGKGQVDLRGRAAGKVKVTLVIKLRGGRTRTDVRTYTTCGR